ncbi:MAG: division/cell wall cluster transcriptional repressor MraZ [Pseudomonadota bacterium]
MFLSSATHTIDTKGRTSVPSPFRDFVGEDAAIYVWPSVHGPFLEGGGKPLMETLQREILDRVSAGTLSPDAAEAQQMVLLGEARRLSYDQTGRIVQPEAFSQHAGLSDAATIFGQGNRFEIWEPGTHATRMDAMRDRAKAAPRLFGVVR